MADTDSFVCTCSTEKCPTLRAASSAIVLKQRRRWHAFYIGSNRGVIAVEARRIARNTKPSCRELTKRFDLIDDGAKKPITIFFQPVRRFHRFMCLYHYLTLQKRL